MIIPFTQYVHGYMESGYETADRLSLEHSLNLSEEFRKNIAYSLYEVTLECEFDTETGQVTLVSAKL